MEDIIKRNKITGAAATPSTSELFHIDLESPRLNVKMAENFHSEVASISYVVKRIKPECWTVTSFLLTRVAGLVQATAPSKLSRGHARHPADSRNERRTSRNRRQH